MSSYNFPSLDCLSRFSDADLYPDRIQLEKTASDIKQAFSDFGLEVEITDIIPGAKITRFELKPLDMKKISAFRGFDADIQRAIAAPGEVKIVAPIPDRDAIGVDVPNKEELKVSFRSLLECPEFKSSSPLSVILGRTLYAEPVLCNIAEMPHLLISGFTGTGKSILLHTMILSILYHADPDDVKLILIDPKTLEFGFYNGVPHLEFPSADTNDKAVQALEWAALEINRRYRQLRDAKVKDIYTYRKVAADNKELSPLPSIVIFIDELADLRMTNSQEIDDSIDYIAHLGRAVGIHLVIATQRATNDAVIAKAKFNIASRISLTVKSPIDPCMIIDFKNTERISGEGDMLYSPIGALKVSRVQVPYISDDDIVRVTDYIKTHNKD